MLLKPAKRGSAFAGLLLLSLAGAACAPPVTRSSVRSTTVGNVRLDERWAPERGVQAVTLRRDNQGFALHVQGLRVCRVWEAEQRFHQHEWASTPNTGMVVGELVMIGTGLGTTTAAWAATKDECGSDDTLASCDNFAHGFALVGLGLAVAGTTALVFDLMSADSGEETTTSLGRATPPHYAPCKNPTLEGWQVRLVAPNVTLSGVLDRQGVARFNVPDQVWTDTGGSMDLDVVLDGHVIGRVVMSKEAACNGC